jgi:hypothetical protein
VKIPVILQIPSREGDQKSRLKGEKGNHSRRYFEESIESFGKARELKDKGLKVKRPQAPGRPQLLIVEGGNQFQ